jgi:two-component system, OmpR family, phosphate regulon response regulator PhoB
MKKVLIIDDDAENLSVVADMIRTQFQPLTSTSGREGILIAIREHPDAILLDVNMPEMDGFEVCKKLREQPGTRRLPIIMLTTASNLDSRVHGLEVGADDYICKPFHARELIARIQARLRRDDIDRKSDSEIALGNLKLDPKSAQVWIDSQSVRLTQLEFELLRYFLERPNQVIDRNTLLGHLWPDAVVTDRTVDTHMANLRKKIKGFSCSLETIYGAGYILKTAPCAPA